jgi:hypothetical protein
MKFTQDSQEHLTLQTEKIKRQVTRITLFILDRKTRRVNETACAQSLPLTLLSLYVGLKTANYTVKPFLYAKSMSALETGFMVNKSPLNSFSLTISFKRSSKWNYNLVKKLFLLTYNTIKAKTKTPAK